MTTKHTRIKGDTALPLNGIAKHGNNPFDWTGYTGKWELEEDDGTVIQASTATGFLAHPTQAFTADATTDLLTCDDHGVEEGDQIIVASTTTLPGGLTASTRYFAVQVTPNKFGLALLPNGTLENITSAGTGTHTFYVVGSFSVTFTDASVDEAGLFRLWVTATDESSDIATFPDNERGIAVEIMEKGN